MIWSNPIPPGRRFTNRTVTTAEGLGEVQSPLQALQSRSPAPGRQAPRAFGVEWQWGLLLGVPEGWGKQRIHT